MHFALLEEFVPQVKIAFVCELQKPGFMYFSIKEPILRININQIDTPKHAIFVMALQVGIYCCGSRKNGCRSGQGND